MKELLTDNARRVLEARYLRRNISGSVIETPNQLFERVARAVSEAELQHGTAADARLWEERFHKMMKSLDFLPNSPTLMNAGAALGQLSACFVLPLEDSMESIFGTLRDMALIQRTGGGTGFSFSKLRPAGAILSTTGGQASGPVSFMRIFDCATENVKQGGRRRGANMGVLRVDHPDIDYFIDAKRDGGMANFNISVGATDEFMSAVETGGDFALKRPSDRSVAGKRAARALMKAICEAAWATGDPGMIFLDSINRANPTPVLGEIESTNPCGEVPLLPYESCNLGSINLSHMVRAEAGKNLLDWDKLRAIAHNAVRFLDDVITVNRYPVEHSAEMARGNRKIGLGVMGLAELFILLGIPYSSADAVSLAEELARFIAREARAASAKLAEERGVFPNWTGSVYAARGDRLRNATVLSIAPTGTISIIADTSSSIEPLFALAYRRSNVLGGQTITEMNPLFLRHVEKLGPRSQELKEQVEVRGTIGEDPTAPEDFRKLFVTALEISPEHHLAIQAAFQKHVDNAVSKTVNLPADSTPDDIERIYTMAYKLGCKGVTVYRYGSKPQQVLELGTDEAIYEREHYARCDPGNCRL